ncbi:MAG: DMT family transporter [Verrucomicrobia bacterium]|nr:MAG: DMT family transporter [Verrucomicrobiota bacterium]
MLRPQTNLAVAISLLFAVFLWGGNNSGTKLLVNSWPPVFTGGTRFLCAGFLLLGVLRWTRWLGTHHSPARDVKLRLWLRGSLSLAAYIVAFNWAVRYTSPSHVALYLGASPVWALLWESFADKSKLSARRWAAAGLALAGVAVLVWPALQKSSLKLTGELLGLAASILWVNYGRQCRALASNLTGAEISAHTMWRAGVWLAPIAFIEVAQRGLPLEPYMAGVQLYCIVAGGVIAFALWNNALSKWPTSQVLLFNNLIPLSTMAWSHFWLHEKVTSTFWIAMVLIASGVVLGQMGLMRRNAAEVTATPE